MGVHDSRYSELRQRAEQALRDTPEKHGVVESDNIHDLIHDMQVYQAEIEIQNEELRQAQITLKQTLDKFTALYHQSPVGYFTMQPDGIIIEANNTLAELIGLPVHALLKHAFDRYLHPDDRGVFLARLRALAEQPQGKQLELRVLDAQGNSHDCLLLASHGLIEGTLLLNVMDITKHKVLERQLKLSGMVLDTTSDGVIVTDSSSRIVSVNRSFCAISGYEAHEVIGKNPNILQSGKQDRQFYRTMWQSLQTHGRWQGMIWNKTKKGKSYPEYLTINAFYNAKGEVEHYVGVFSDMTRQLSLEQQFQQAQKMEAIGTLVGGIAHDFNNILAGISGNSFLASAHLQQGKTAESQQRIDAIDALTQRAASMIAQLMAFARKGIVQKDYLPMNHFVQDFLKLAKVTIPENIRVQLSITDEPVAVHGDSTQMQQVLLNVLNNARDAVEGRDAPTIEITLSRFQPDSHFLLKHPDAHKQAYVHLMVRDNGCGIEEKDVERIFDPFFTTKTVGKGTGLGLSMVIGVMQSHDGVIDVESHPAQGTGIHLYLPLVAQQHEEDVVAPLEPPAPLASSFNETILLADDEGGVREPMKAALESLGYCVMTAEDGRDALNLFQSHRDEVDIALLDVVMPYDGGVSLARKIRAIAPHLPIIFMTGYDRERVLGEPLDNSEILTKPVKIHRLNESIQRQLHSRLETSAS